jgi:acetyl esterase/lipase
MPRTLVQVGGDEMLYDDCIEFVDRYRQQNQAEEDRVVLQEFPGLFHDFQMIFWLKESQIALDCVGEFIQKEDTTKILRAE